MISYKPASIPRISAKALGQPVVPAAPAVPPPSPDPLFTGYTGTPGFIEIAAVLTISASAAWVGIRTGLSKQSKTIRIAGWVGGIGSALIGLLYLGGKSGLNQVASLPAVRVTPS